MPIKREGSRATGIAGIKEDGPNRFLVHVTWVDQRTSKRKSRVRVATSLDEAKRLKAELRGVEVVEKPSRVRFSEYARKWLALRVDQLAVSTFERYTRDIANAIVDLGDFWIDALKPADIREWQAKGLKHAKPVTVNGWLRVVRAVLRTAETDEVIARNPASAVKAAREGRTGGKRGTAYSPAQLATFLQKLRQLVAEGAIAEDVGRFVEVLVWTGMRRGEALVLKWDDRIGDEIYVSRSLYKAKEKATKTGDPRFVTVVAPLAEVLEAQRKWLLQKQHPGLASGLMFPAQPRNAKGAVTRCGRDEVAWYRAASIFDDAIAKVVVASGLPGISPHGFRRTWENVQRKAGVEQLVRRSTSGWRSEEAQAIYATVDSEERKEAGARAVALVIGAAT